MMKAINIIHNFLGAMAFVGLSACQTEADIPQMPIDNNDGVTTVSLVIPEMDSASTRSFDDTPDWSSLKLHIMIFDARGSFVKYISQDSGEITNVRPVESEKKVYYDVKLPYSSAPRVLHLVASQYDINYAPGREEISMSALELSGNQDAYWNKVELPNGIGVYDETTNAVSMGDEAAKLKDLKLIRNFARISVGVDNSSEISTDQYDGFVLINQPNAGTVVPYITEVSGARQSHFADYNFDVAANESKYDRLIQTYTGWEPQDRTLNNQDATDADINDAPKYLYERTYHNVQSYKPSFVVIKARPDATKNEWYYYHIDLVKLDASSGQATGYHILRNFDYSIKILNVKGEGYATLQEAINGNASNNISYSQTTKDLHSISDTNGDKITVDYTQKTHVKTETKTFNFSYVDGKGQSLSISDFEVVVTNNQYGILVDEGGVPLPDGHKFGISGSNGNYSISYTVVAAQYGSAYFRVYKKGGLGREIEVISRNPWEFEITKTNSAGTVNTTILPTDYAGNFGGNQNDLINLHINVPENMPRSTFPLKFYFESRKQLVYPNSEGVLTTTTGKTTFDNGGSSDIRIIYLYTVEWKDYKSEGMVITAPFKFNANSGSDKSDVIRVTNEYFAPSEIAYTRN